uniref:Uncharacterized protein n=1 Tax=Brassica oleracea TaxID=3712 RepID=A0A3P6DN93_BRAOL|nr:unnamed protein product [Brassica oleracea]
MTQILAQRRVIVAAATARHDQAEFITTDRQPRPPSCFSRRDEAVATDHAAIGARTKPIEPSEVSHPRERDTLAPPQSTGAAVHSGHAPLSPTAVHRSRRARPPSVRRSFAAAGSFFRHRDCLMLELGLHSCSAMN